jgi:hypothetical protein
MDQAGQDHHCRRHPEHRGEAVTKLQRPGDGAAELVVDEVERKGDPARKLDKRPHGLYRM